MKILRLLSIVVLCFIGLTSQSQNRAITFYGKMTKSESGHVIEAIYCPHSIFEGNYFLPKNMDFGLIHKTVKVDQHGNFKIVFNDVSSYGRIKIVENSSERVIISNLQVVELGDSINISFKQGDDFHFSFTGRGHKKYECVQDLTKISDGVLYNSYDKRRRLAIGDSLLINKLKILEEYNTDLKPEVYKIIKADILGSIKNKLMWQNCNAFKPDMSITEIAADKNAFFEIAKVETFTSDSILSFSHQYIDFLYNKSKMELGYKYGGKHFQFQDLYQEIRENFNGIMKDELLVHAIINDDVLYFFNGVDGDAYSSCLKDAYNIVKKDYLKQIVRDYIEKRAKGAAAFNFELPRDSSNQKVSLSNLKGKVVLVDMWAYPCGSCIKFSKAFHEKIYPLFKGDSNFKVVSILLLSGNRDIYRKRLRNDPGLGGNAYTFKEYINLYGAEGEPVGRQLEKHYRIYAAPFIILIDKRGKIFSSTIPFFTDENSPNIQKLTDLIRQVLSESS